MKQHEAFIGAFAYHYGHFERNLSVVSGKGSSQLVGLVRVVQLVKLYLITLNLRGGMWKGLSQLVRVVQLVKLRIIMETYSPFER